MSRALLAALLAAAAPGAAAWVPCEQKGIVPPKPVYREAPPYPDAVRAMGIEGFVEVALTALSSPHGFLTVTECAAYASSTR